MIILNEFLNYKEDVDTEVCFLFTGNNVVKRNGDLVMGKGNAKACAEAFPNAPEVFGKLVNNNPEVHCHFEDTPEKGVHLGYFRTKEHYASDSTLQLIAQSTKELKEAALACPEILFLLPAPGIGAGGLKWAHVEAILKILPDNVIIFKP